ncbi:MAG: hypothetical protein AMXMBFR7_21900 [Planctomycetota bacterium]
MSRLGNSCPPAFEKGDVVKRSDECLREYMAKGGNTDRVHIPDRRRATGAGFSRKLLVVTRNGVQSVSGECRRNYIIQMTRLWVRIPSRAPNWTARVAQR